MENTSLIVASSEAGSTSEPAVSPIPEQVLENPALLTQWTATLEAEHAHAPAMDQ